MAGVVAAEYVTADLGEAAFLVARGPPLARLEGRPSERKRFVFTEEAAGDGSEYLAGGVVAAHRFADALRALKGRLRRGY